MKSIIKHTLKILVTALALFVTGCDNDEALLPSTFTNLVMQDEFNTDGFIDTSIWNFDIGDGTDQGIPGWGNNELQFYTNNPENITVENGFLLITAREESVEGYQYTSARIQTKGKFQSRYGRFEARIRAPFGQGLWPAFWLLGDDSDGQIWPQIGEIDIMENTGDASTEIFGSVHGPGYSGGESISNTYEFPNSRADTEFHVYAIEWEPNVIKYFVDDELYAVITPDVVEDETDGAGQWVFNDRPFYIILNVAVGGNLPGAPDASTTFPQTMLVDYVRVYQQ